MRALDDCGDMAEAGGKARTLARVRAAGLPALDGVVVLPGETVDDAALDSALGGLGGAAFAVRSSADVEDLPEATAAGVFESVIGARGREAVTRAIARVRESANGEPVRAYLSTHGRTGPARMSVLIQPLAQAARLAVARSRASDFLVEERAAGEPEWGDVRARAVARGSEGLGALLARVEALVGGAADVELAFAADGAATILQARRAPPLPDADAQFALDGDWRLDAEHNPQPLSAAQAGLVALVDALGVGPRQRVVGGWLFVAREPVRGAQPIPVAELRKRFDGEVAPDCRARLDAVDPADLTAALAAYTHVWRRYVVEVGPSLSRARQQLDGLLRANLGEPLAAHGELLAGLGGATRERDQLLWRIGRGEPLLDEYRARFGMLAPAWDVAVPCDDEAEPRVIAAAQALAGGRAPDELHAEAEARAKATAHALLERLDRMARGAFKALLPIVREALPVAEDDDLLFFAAQRLVRRALLVRGERLRVAGLLDVQSDVFEVPLDTGDDQARALAVEGRKARLEATRREPPTAVDGGRPRFAAPEARQVLRGHASFGRARGRAVQVRSPADAPAALPDGAVLVVPAILPSLAYLLPRARALVTEHGGATSHGATLAREYGVPAVLGAPGASAIADGEGLFVDGAAGRVYRL